MAEHDLEVSAFPKLDDNFMAALAKCPKAVLMRFKAGQKLYQTCELDAKFFVVKAGEVEIVDESGDTPKLITIHHPGQFTGDVSQLTGGPRLVSAIARTDCEAYAISTEGLREILNKYPDLGDTILQAFIARRQLLSQSGSVGGLRVVGSRYSQDTFRIREFLANNHVLFTWLDLEIDPQVGELLKQFGLTEADTPVVMRGRKPPLRNPSNFELAEMLGIRRPFERTVYDLAIVGSGPAGLAAAVYGASEGLRTVVMERSGPGGQAGRSMRIENYLGFPMGITGGELAERAVLQANKFGANLPVPTPITELTFDNAYKVLSVDGRETVTAKCLLIATGAEYRRLSAEGCEPFEGCGVYYAATFNEVTMCRGAEVAVVGAGNSAGQAVVFLAGQAKKVYLIVRGDNLYKDMSSYLVRRIEQTPNIEVLYRMEVKRMFGDGHLSEIEIVNNQTREIRKLKIPALFSFIGASPRTDWLPPEIERDAKGFVRTGPDLVKSPQWTAVRPPYLLETTRPGVFAAGDVRSGSVKRVASATIGEGSMAVQFVHEYLKQM